MRTQTHTSARDSCLTDSRLLSFVKFSVTFCSSVVIFANLLIKSALSFSASDTDTSRSCKSEAAPQFSALMSSKQTSRLISQSFVTKHDEPSFNCNQSEVSFSYFTKVLSHKRCLLCIRTANWKQSEQVSCRYIVKRLSGDFESKLFDLSSRRLEKKKKKGLIVMWGDIKNEVCWQILLSYVVANVIPSVLN